jgi:hypothetical protein
MPRRPIAVSKLSQSPMKEPPRERPEQAAAHHARRAALLRRARLEHLARLNAAPRDPAERAAAWRALLCALTRPDAR